MTAPRTLSSLLLVASAAVLALVAWILLVADPRVSAALLVGDDAGYYLAIARNVCLGHGLSFDRVHATNGFNPLETLLLVGADRLLGPSPTVIDCYRIGLFLSLAALLGGLWGFIRLLEHALDPSWFAGERRRLAVAAAVAFYAMFIVPKKQFGMDAALVMLVGCAYLARVSGRGLLGGGAFAAIGDGLLLGLLVLARVDNLPLLAAAFAIMALLAPGTPRGWSALGRRATWAAMVITPYLTWSYDRFGSLLPVSARIKSSFPHADLAASLAVIRGSSVNAADQAGFALAFLGSWIVLGLGARAARTGTLRARLGEPRVATLAVLALYLALRLGYMLLFSRTDVQGGYVMLAHVFNLLALFEVAAWLARRMPARAGALATGAAAALALFSLALFAGKAVTMRERILHPGEGDEWTLARRIHDATTPDDVLYGGAFGLMAFFADRAWINGDGVANSDDYQRAFLTPGGLARWLEASEVTHVVWAARAAPAPGAGPLRLTVRGILAGRDQEIEVDPRDLVLTGRLARGLARGAPGSTVVVARWRPRAS